MPENIMSEQRQSKKRIISEEFHKYASETTLHGIKHVADSKSSWLIRLIWLVFFLGLLGYFIAVMASRVMLYRQYPVSTKLQVINRKPMDFPAVTICNFNQIQKSYLEANYLIKEVFLAINPLTFHLTTLDFSDPEILTQINEVDIAEMVINGSQSLSEMFVQCAWKNQEVNCSDYFTPTYTKLGICYTFNSKDFIRWNKERLTVSRNGKMNALKLTINVDQYEYFYQDGDSGGIKVLVHDPFIPPLIDELGFAAGPGSEVFAAMQEIRVKKLPKPYEGSKCIDTKKSDYVNPLAYFDTYSRASCRLECFINYTLHAKNCKCNHMYVRGGDYPVCNFTWIVHCAIPASEEYYQMDDIEEACGCTETCDEVYYEISKSEASFPSTKRSKELQDILNITDYDLRENLLTINIYFEDLTFTFIEQLAAYSLGDLQADIGGNLGLCLGASLLSVVEFLEFIMYMFMSICHKIQNVGKATKSGNS